MAKMPANAEFKLPSELLGIWPPLIIGGWKTKQNHDHRCLYALMFSLLIDFFFVHLYFRVSSFYQLHFVILWLKKLTSKKFLFTPFITFLFLECPATIFFLVTPFSISEWRVTLFLPVPNRQELVAFLVWRWLMIFSSLELSSWSLILLLNSLDNGMTFSCNSLFLLNAYFNIYFRNLMRIFLILSSHAFAQVLPF